jgi:hypothetical protein
MAVATTVSDTSTASAATVFLRIDVNLPKVVRTARC